ncbi:MAG: hypothetical protein ACRDTP_05500, partial [Mycobacteriales bacterium]
MAHFLAAHGLHLAGVVAAVAWIAVDRYRRHARRNGTTDRTTPGLPPRAVAMYVIAVGLIAAAAVHVVVIPEHFAESTLYGIFFV